MESGPVWQPFSVVDDYVLTGQNPASSREVAQKRWRASTRAHAGSTSSRTRARGRSNTKTASRKACSAPRNRPIARSPRARGGDDRAERSLRSLALGTRRCSRWRWLIRSSRPGRVELAGGHRWGLRPRGWAVV